MLGCILKSKDPSPKWNPYKCIRGNNRSSHKSKWTLRLELVIKNKKQKTLNVIITLFQRGFGSMCVIYFCVIVCVFLFFVKVLLLLFLREILGPCMDLPLTNVSPWSVCHLMLVS